jgi:cysteine desulfurase
MTVYLDHAATTPLRTEALNAMLPWLMTGYGNPSSPHLVGRRARAGLDEARELVAHRLHAEPREVVFTSGGTESINLAIKGAAWAGKAMGNRIITSSVEHKAVLEACAHLAKFSFEIVALPVDRYGRVDPDDLTRALNDRTILVSIQLANNEVGTIQPIAEMVRRVEPHRQVLFHVDAVQAAPWLDLNPTELGIDLLSIAGHKLEGPKGTGVLWIRRGTAILPQIHGGTQERYRRAGTEDVAGAVGLATAFDLACTERDETSGRVNALRVRLRDAVLAVEGVELTGHPRKRIPGSLSVVVRDLEGDAAVLALDLEGICISTGSACTTGSLEPSHVLTAMGYPNEEARGSLRFTLGRTTTTEEVDRAAELVPAVLGRLRQAQSDLVADPFGIEQEVGA